MKTPAHENLEETVTALRESVRSALAGAQCAHPLRAEIDRHFERLGAELGLVLNEHAGMAEELLRAYEQLGIVFEATHSLPTVQSEEAVVRLFIDSLRITYHDNRIFYARRADDRSLVWAPEAPPAGALVARVVEESARDAKVVVRTLPAPAEGVDEIMSAPVLSGDDFVCAIVFTHRSDARRFQASDMSLVAALVSFCGDLIRNYRLTRELRELSINMVRALVSAIDQKDAYTSGHSNRVGQFAKLLGARLGLNEEELQMLEWAALLHDVGKIGIRDDVLKKPGKLTREELEHIREHPVRSYEMVSGVPQLKAALDGVRHHHERYDGSGYPDGLAGEGIPLQARIILVADIFDALTTSRSYRAAFDVDKALAIMREEAGSVSDPALVPLFEKLIREEVAQGRISFERLGPEAAPEPSDPGRCDRSTEESTA